MRARRRLPAAVVLLIAAAHGGRRGDAGPAAAYTTWPNPLSQATSEPWIVAHHDEVQLVQPRVLVLMFANPGTLDEAGALLKTIVAGLAEGSRPRGVGPPQLQYEVVKVVDLRDGVAGRPPAPAGWRYQNSTLFPRRAPGEPGGWRVKYAELFTARFAAFYGFPDPSRPGAFLDLCALVGRGLVHEVWMIAAHTDDGDAVPAEILGLMPNYDAAGNKLPGPPNRCAGNGCFDADVPYCGRTLRIAFINYRRGPGCFLHNVGHGIEWSSKNAVPSLREWFAPFAGFDLQRRYGLPFDSLYWENCSEGRCIEHLSPGTVRFTDTRTRFTRTIEGFDPVCGNVHLPPNAVRHYDYAAPRHVQSSCAGFGRHQAPFGKDAVASVDAQTWLPRFKPYNDCGGEFLVWWFQNMPGHGSGQTFADGRRMKSMWPFLAY